MIPEPIRIICETAGILIGLLFGFAIPDSFILRGKPEQSPAVKPPEAEPDPHEMSDPKRAILHVLRRIRDDSGVGWYMGHCTESFERLTAAYAAMSESTVEEVKSAFSPTNPRNPKDTTEEEDTYELAATKDIDDKDVLEAMECFTNATRMEVMQELLSKFCQRCGGFNPAGLGCQCNVGRTPKLPTRRQTLAVV